MKTGSARRHQLDQRPELVLTVSRRFSARTQAA